MAQCCFRGCVYPAIWTTRDVRGDVNVCSSHGWFLAEEKKEYDEPIRETFHELTSNVGLPLYLNKDKVTVDDHLAMKGRTRWWGLSNKARSKFPFERHLDRQSKLRKRALRNEETFIKKQLMEHKRALRNEILPLFLRRLGGLQEERNKRHSKTQKERYVISKSGGVWLPRRQETLTIARNRLWEEIRTQVIAKRPDIVKMALG